jgi:hypothetical protein
MPVKQMRPSTTSTIEERLGISRHHHNGHQSRQESPLQLHHLLLGLL